MMKEGTGGRKGARKEDDGNRNAREDGRKEKIICPGSGMTGVSPGAVAYGLEYCYFLLDRIISL